MQGNHTIDIDALLAERKMEPVPVKLGGKTYQVRTDLTVKEVNRFLALTRSNNDAQAMTILVGTVRERQVLHAAITRVDAGEEKVELPAGKTAQALADYLDTLPRLHQALAGAQIYRATKALADLAATDEELLRRHGIEPDEPEGTEGESEAS